MAQADGSFMQTMIFTA